MAYEYKTLENKALSSFGGESDVVIQVTLVCRNPSNGKQRAINVALDMDDFDPSQGFTTYDQVTEDQLVAWAKGSLPDWKISELEADVS